jgi:hypothetical protein
VHSLAKTWNLPWPEKLRLSKLVPREGNVELAIPATGPRGEGMIFGTKSTPEAARDAVASEFPPNLPPAATSERRESLSMFAPSRNASLVGVQSSSNLLSAHQQQQQQLPHHSTPTVPYSSAAAAAVSASAPTPSAAENAETLFWTPMPGVGVPVLHRNYQMSPMDLNNMLGSADEWERFGRDGFKMSETWPSQESIGNLNPGGSNGDGSVGTMGSGGASGYGPMAAPGVRGQEAPPPGPGYEWWGGNNGGGGGG